MKPLDKLLSFIGLARKATTAIPLISGATGEFDPFSLWISQKKLAADKAMAIYNGWVYACVRAIAEEVAKIDLKLFQVNADGASEEIEDHEILDILSSVNHFQTKFELFFITAAHLELAGNAYWFLDGVQKESDKPTAIYSLNPKYIKIIKEDIPTFISGYQYTVGSKKQRFEPFQILHFKYPDPNDPYEGIGTVQAISDWINADNYASQVNLNYFKNGARLAGVLESENFVTPEQLDYMKKMFMQLYASAANAYQIAALPKGTKFTPMSDTPKDMDFANLQTTMRDKILAGFRVSKTILGTAESDTNRATAETADYVFAERTIKPKMHLIVSYLNEFLISRYGDNLYLDFIDPVPKNRDLEIAEMAAASGGQPILSPNESRERFFGAPPVAHGDALRGSAILQEIGAPEQPTKEAKPQSKTVGKQRPSPRFAKNAKRRKNIAEEIVGNAFADIKETITKATEIVKQKSIADMSEAEFENIYKVFALRVTPYKNQLAEKIKGFNAGQKKEVLKNLPNAVKTKAIDPADLFNRQTFVTALIDLSEPLLIDLYGKEGEAAAELIGAGKLDILTPEVRKAIRDAVDLMSNKYNDTTLDALKEKLEQGIGHGASLDELKDLVSGIYEWSDETRAERVAETETFRIANDATKQAWKQTGVVKSLKWYTAEDERVCPFCAPLQGKVVSIEENFFAKGDTVEGTDESGKTQTLNLDYADVGAPPLHVSCRCYIRPEEISLAAPTGETKQEAKPNVEEIVKAEVEKQTAAIKIAADAEIERIKKDAEEKVGEIKKQVEEALS